MQISSDATVFHRNNSKYHMLSISHTSICSPSLMEASMCSQDCSTLLPKYFFYLLSKKARQRSFSNSCFLLPFGLCHICSSHLLVTHSVCFNRPMEDETVVVNGPSTKVRGGLSQDGLLCSSSFSFSPVASLL